MNEKLTLRGQSLSGRRLALWLVVLGAFLLMGFYAATDPTRMAGDPLLDGADIVGYAVCHRITGHSLTVAGRQLPLCARCTGIYLGVMLVFASVGLAGRWRWSDLPPLRVLLVLAGFIAIMGVDGLNSYSHFFPAAPHLYEPRNWLRLLTGLGTGLAMGIITLPALAQSLWREQVRRAPVRSGAELAGLVALAAFLALLVLSNRPGLLYVLAIISAAGVVLILTTVNSILLLVLLRRDAQAATWRQVLLPLGAGLGLALLQIGAIGAVRYALTGTMTGFPGL